MTQFPTYSILLNTQVKGQEMQTEQFYFNENDIIESRKLAISKFKELNTASKNNTELYDYALTLYFEYPTSDGRTTISLNDSRTGSDLNHLVREANVLSELGTKTEMVSIVSDGLSFFSK